MTNDELDRLEASANAATPGPWVVNGGVPEQVIHCPTKRHPNRTTFHSIVWLTQTDYASGEYYADMMDADAAFIAAARDAVPALVDALKPIANVRNASSGELVAAANALRVALHEQPALSLEEMCRRVIAAYYEVDILGGRDEDDARKALEGA